jgi:tetratricopeptide (TPR) repeat protein
LFDLRRFDEALLNFEKALARPRFAEDDEKIRTLQWSIARTLREVGRVKEAYDLLHVISAEQEKLGKVNGHVSLEIAECLQAQEKHQDAKIYFEKAHVELSLDPWYVDNKQAELARMLFLWKRRT